MVYKNDIVESFEAIDEIACEYLYDAVYAQKRSRLTFNTQYYNIFCNTITWVDTKEVARYWSKLHNNHRRWINNSYK